MTRSAGPDAGDLRAAVADGGYGWVETPSRAQDLHVAFRGEFEVPADGPVEMRVLACSWFRLHVDGAFVLDGPPRFPPSHPEYVSARLDLPQGRHVLAVQVHHLGVATRLQPDIPPFLWCSVGPQNAPAAVRWRCRELPAFRPTGKRTSPILGWVEWLDLRLEDRWHDPAYDDAGWDRPVPVAPGLGELRPLSSANVSYSDHRLVASASGRLTETMPFYELDDPAARFFARELAGTGRDGVWRRYDLGRVRLGTPRFVIDAPAGAVVEFGGSDFLAHGQVAPYLPGSTGASCNLDHFVSRGGPQELRPLTPKGLRYLEVHVLAADGEVGFLDESFVERGYYGDPTGSFSCGDPVLERIWRTSVDTLRACTEDAVTDCPTRERGQWLGDVTVGLEVAGAAYGDLRVFRRALVQAAECADLAGFVAGLYPGTSLTVATFAAQWPAACLRHLELTGDSGLIEQLYPAATRNIEAFAAHLSDTGLTADLPWSFIDWGYEPAQPNVALHLHVVSAAQAHQRWAGLVGDPDGAAFAGRLESRLRRVVARSLRAAQGRGTEGWTGLGYHSTVLAMRLDLVPPGDMPGAAGSVKQHMLACFPNDAHAPRLSDPSTVSPRVITPYFAHWALAALAEAGEMDFALEQMRRCWGWMSDQGATTWFEVFDDRWSQCHQWSGAPAWQLSRYVLGLQPRLDRGPGAVDLRVVAGSLRRASGVVPLPDGGRIAVTWDREGDELVYTLETSTPLALRVTTSEGLLEPVSVSGGWRGRVPAWP